MLDPRSMSCHFPTVVAPTTAMDEADGAGALFQVIPVSVKAPATVRTVPDDGLASVTKRRSLAERTGPVSPLTSKDRYDA